MTNAQILPLGIFGSSIGDRRAGRLDRTPPSGLFRFERGSFKIDFYLFFGILGNAQGASACCFGEREIFSGVRS